MAEGGVIEQLDTAIANFFGSWNFLTTLLVGFVLVILIYPIVTAKEPDTHPFLLARQAQASPIRQPGETAVYRSSEIPYGYPLRSGLGVKDANAPKWHSGRNGDLRDIWRLAVKGAPGAERGKILTIFGREKVTEHDLLTVTGEINAIGKHIQQGGGKKVAVCLSNSVEMLAAVFAGAFYDFSPILVPYGQQPKDLASLVAQTDADVLIAEVGSIALSSLLPKVPSIRNVIWVAKAGSKHLDWNEVPEGVGGKVDVSTWHDIVEEGKSAAIQEVPTFDSETKCLPVASFWPDKSGKHELVEYPSECIISGVAGLLASLPRNHKLGPTDLLLPAISLTRTYALCWTLAAFFSGASVALNSVAGEDIDFTVAAYDVTPTLVITSADAVSKHQTSITAAGSGISNTVSTYFQKQALAAGNMPKVKSVPATSPVSKLRFLLIAQRDCDPSAGLKSTVLSNVRLALGARVGYALTAGPVAGAVTQSNFLDYRDKADKVSLGAPLSSVEIYLTGDEDAMSKENPKGKVTVRGPAVVGRKAVLDVVGQIDADHTLLLA